MAVGRIKASHQWFYAVARQVWDHPRLARELERAAGRPGRRAELTAAEIRVLAERRPTDRRVADALVEVYEAESREREAHIRLQAMLARRREG